MSYKKSTLNLSTIIAKNFIYSLKIIFANKFIYFLTAAVLFFLFVTTINLFAVNSATEDIVYYMLLFPGILLIFYPTTFGIQNDEDSGMLENLFAIPNYRYKVWLPRLGFTYVLVFLLLLGLAALSSVAIASISIFEMVYQLMFPIFFLGSLAFAFSTIIRNGNGTAVLMVVIGLIFWISAGILEGSEWNIFLNPFELPENVSENIWETVITSNRLYLFAGTLLSILFGLFNLQNREKFV